MAVILGTDGADTITETVTVLGQPLATAGADSIAGLGGDDSIDAGSGDDTVLGGDGNDVLRGGLGSNLLRGGAGNDSLFGGRDADTLEGGPGADAFDGGSGDNTPGDNWVTYADAAGPVTVVLGVPSFNTGEAFGDTHVRIGNLRGSAFDDRLFGSGFANILDGGEGDDSLAGGVAGADTLLGGGGNDTLSTDTGSDTADQPWDSTLLQGGAGADSLRGRGGPDTLDGGAGADTLAGGPGEDFASYASAMAGLAARLDTPATNTGDAAGDLYSGIEHLEGSAHADTLRGDALAQRILGGAGDDSLEAGAGDTLDGGEGADTYLFVAGAMIADSGSDGARDTIRTAIELLPLPTVIEDLVLLGTLRFGFGNALGNRITGNAADNVMDGGDGADTLDGGSGDDVLIGAAGRDTFIVDSRHDTPVDEAVTPGHVIASLGWRLGAFFADLTLTGIGSFQGVGNALDNRMIGNAGRNALNGFTGADTLLGDGGNDSLVGRDGHDLLHGEAGADLLSGDAGADTLDGGAGPDTLKGGAGSDAFVFSVAPTQADRINDYTAGEPLLLRLAAFDPGGGTGLVLGALAAQPGRFLANTSGLATTAEARFIHETDAGRLFFDPDGHGAGAAMLVVTLAGAPALSAADIMMT